MVKISASILSADFARLEEEINNVLASGADWIHLDVMDGNFVPNLTFGAPVIKKLREKTNAFFDAHLMVNEPSKYYLSMKEAGVNLITIHAEATNHLERDLVEIKKMGLLAGVSLNPHTPLNFIEYVLDKIDLLLLMTVNPGFGGQIFIDSMYKKIEKARKIIDDSNSKILLEVDGGINNNNSKSLRELGVDIFVAGSYIFENEDYKIAIDSLK